MRNRRVATRCCTEKQTLRTTAEGKRNERGRESRPHHHRCCLWVEESNVSLVSACSLYLCLSLPEERGGVGLVHGLGSVKLHNSSSCGCLCLYSYRSHKETLQHSTSTTAANINKTLSTHQLNTPLLNSTNKNSSTLTMQLYRQVDVFIKVERGKVMH